VSGGNVNSGRCAQFAQGSLAGVTAADYVILRGPAVTGWQASVATVAASSITVMLCNNTGGNANPNGQTITFLAIH
jgi:hypothetical protein